jgi:hypothetical protein
MSTSINIFSYLKPSKKLLCELSAEDGLEINETNNGKSAGNLLVQKSVKGKMKTVWIIDGPFKVEQEDLPDELDGQTRLPKWLLQFTISAAASNLDLEMAMAMSGLVADELDGFAFIDDELFYPEKIKKPLKKQSQTKQAKNQPKKQTKERRGPLVTLEFHFARKQAAKTFLKVARRFCPEAVPRRFGYYDPLPGKFDDQTESVFVNEWKRLVRDKNGDGLTWTASYPCLEGHIGCSHTGGDSKKEYSRGIEQSIIEITFDGQVLKDDQEWCKKVVRLFEGLAVELDAFYAAGYVERNMVIYRSRIYIAHDSESISLQATDWSHTKWLGIPRTPTWLVWYGGPYAKLLKHIAKENQTDSSAIFLRHGKEPVDTDTAKKKFPRIPEQFLAKEKKLAANISPNIICSVAERIPSF